MNVICLSGRLTHDPKLWYSKKNTPIGEFNLANHDTTRDDLYFNNIKVFGIDAENLQQYYHKGREISFSGHFEMSNKGIEIIADTIYFGPRKEQVKDTAVSTHDNF